MIVIVGLGNPEKKYDNTYHNVGFKSIDYFAKSNGIEFTKKKYNAMVGEGVIEGQKVILMKPTTYMNASGISVSQVVNQLKLPLEKLVVIYDDADLPCGTLRFRKQGSAGTHNGMRSIVGSLGSEKFARLRVGIGKDDRIPIIDYVLAHINKENLSKIEESLPKLNGVLKEYIKSDGQVESIDVNKF